jgi:hypothetical protein
MTEAFDIRARIAAAEARLAGREAAFVRYLSSEFTDPEVFDFYVRTLEVCYAEVRAAKALAKAQGVEF